MDDLPELEELGAITDPVARGKRAHELASRYDAVADEARRIRREALSQAVNEAGWSQGGIAKVLSLTRSRVGQLITKGPQPERALLGIGPLTVAVASKREGPKAAGPSSAMTSEESGRARDLIIETAKDYGLSAEGELVRPGETLRLDRPNLVVIGSPRLLPAMKQILEADPHLGFATEDGKRWFLTEHDTIHRSPNDNNEDADLAYIGRLPRTDSKGSFLYLAGIHAPGTLGAATYLTEHIADLYEEVKRGRWSMLVRSTYDPDSREVQSVERITPIYKP